MFCEKLSQGYQLICTLLEEIPASPILFLLYTEPLLKISSRINKYIFANDLAILQAGRMLALSKEFLAKKA